jgi:hypothetical protein
MLTAHTYNNPVPRSRECEVGGELPPERIAAMLIVIMAATMAVSAGMAWTLDAWWPYVAGAVACFIIAKTA